ncbi:CHAT domain-containing tetratricopeptide repeat protein [Janthinobacterium sp. SUN211]|nr:CHAT domain-containing tetratricopeptide repeat protein [Janthinobacterium sp. SUN211]
MFFGVAMLLHAADEKNREAEKYISAVQAANKALLLKDVDQERIQFQIAVAAFDQLLQLPADATLPKIFPLTQDMPGLGPGASRESQLFALNINRRLLPMAGSAYGKTSEQYGKVCSRVAYLTAQLGDPKAALPYMQCYLSGAETRLKAPSIELGLARAAYAEAQAAAGDLSGALTTYDRALKTMADAGGMANRAYGNAMSMYAELLRRAARHDEYEAVMRQALDILYRVAGPVDVDYLGRLGALINFYQEWGRTEEAEALVWKAYNELEVRAPFSFEMAVAVWRAGGVALANGLPDEAITLFERSLKLHLAIMGDSYYHVGSVLADMGEAYYSAKRPEEGRRRMEMAIAHFKKIGQLDTTNGAAIYLRMGIYAQEAGENDAALDFLIAAHKISEKIPVSGRNWEQEAAIDYQLARCLIRIGDGKNANILLLDAMKNVRDALAISGTLQVESTKTRAVFRPIVSAYLAFSLKKPETTDVERSFEALQLANLSTSAAAIAGMAAREISASPDLTNLVYEHQKKIERVRDLDQRISGLVASARVEQEASLHAERETLNKDVVRIATELKTKFPEYRALVGSAPVSTGAVRTALRANEAMLAYYIDKNLVCVWLVRQSGVTVHVLPVDAGWVDGAVAKLRQGLRLSDSEVPNFDLVLAHEIYVKLLSTVTAELAGIDHVFVVPDGALQTLPVGLLLASPPKSDESFAKQDWLVRRYALSVLPSVSALVSLRKRNFFNARGWPRSFAGVGDPRLGVKRDIWRLSDLPDTRFELQSMSRLLHGDPHDLLLAEMATKAGVLAKDFSGFRFVTFATHTLILKGAKGDEQPALVLTPTDPEGGAGVDDGLLSAVDISQMKMNADLVILSACNTGQEGVEKGRDKLSGLATAFFHAGARTLMVSHWYVSSKGAAELATSMMQRLAADPRAGKAEALRQAMLEMIVSRSSISSHPAIWAPFSIIGDGAAVDH